MRQIGHLDKTSFTCPGCGMEAEESNVPINENARSSIACSKLYEELSAYTLGLADPAFAHQHAVDAYAAQHHPRHSKLITVAFALAGLYLAAERGFNGKQVQRAHMLLAKRRRAWPVFECPGERNWMTVGDVVAGKPGLERDLAIKRWATSVWKAWSSEHGRVAQFVGEQLDDV